MHLFGLAHVFCRWVVHPPTGSRYRYTTLFLLGMMIVRSSWGAWNLGLSQDLMDEGHDSRWDMFFGVSDRIHVADIFTYI